MTWEELIEKAVEHAGRTGIPIELLHHPKVRETALVSFVSQDSTGTAKFQLDAITGALISAQLSSSEFAPKCAGKQLSQRAQRVMALAGAESGRLGCHHIGSDHLLLGLLVSGEGVGPAVLSSAGLTQEAVRHRIASIGSASEVAVDGYGPSLRNIIRLASHHAEILGDLDIEPEHFVLALFKKADGPAMSIFRHFGVNTRRAWLSLVWNMSKDC